MAEGYELMHSAPPEIIDKAVSLLVPPASREEVLGDLCEGYTSAGQYIKDALRVIPMVILSRIMRTAGRQVLLMGGTALYLSYMGAAWYQGKRSPFEDPGFLKLVIPPVMVLFGVILEDAFSHGGKRSFLKLLRGPVFGLGFAYLSQVVFSAESRTLALPPSIMFYGSAMTLLFAIAVKMLFPSALDRQVGVGGPALWLKQAAEPLQITPGAMPVTKSLGFVLLLGVFAGQIGGPALAVALILISVLFPIVRELRARR